MTTAREIQEVVEEWESRFWDEDHPDYDEDASHESIWEKLYHSPVWEWDAKTQTGGYVEYNSVDVPGLGTIKVVDRWDDHDDGHALHVVFTVNDDPQTYEMTGWDNSWDGGWEGPLTKVEGKQVVKTEWSVIND